MVYPLHMDSHLPTKRKDENFWLPDETLAIFAIERIDDILNLNQSMIAKLHFEMARFILAMAEHTINHALMGAQIMMLSEFFR